MSAGFRAMVLAAGEGTRLRPLTATLPKPMVPVANTPLLTRTLRFLKSSGIDEIAVNLHHRADAILAALGDGSAEGVRLRYSLEETLLGTAGGVKRLADFFDGPFVVLYGDNVYRFDLGAILARHRELGVKATVATFTAPNPTACGLLLTDSRGIVTRFEEKPPVAFTDQANAGVYVLEPEILDLIPPNTVSDFGHDIFPALLSRFPGAMAAVPLGGYLRDTGTPESYRQANWDAIEFGERAVSESAKIAPSASLTGRNVIGDGCEIGDGARISESVLWERSRVGDGAVVESAILGRKVRIGAGAIVRSGAILADGVHVADGAVVAEKARIPPDAFVDS